MRNLILIFLLFIGCNEDNSNETVEEPQALETNPELLVLNEDVENFNFGGIEIPVQDYTEDAYIHQGDILIPKDFKSAKVYEPGEEVKSTARLKGIWPDNTVYYSIDPNLTKTYRITDAIKMWTDSSNLKFEKRTNQRNYIYFTTGNGCSSFIGMIGGAQKIMLNTGCTTGNVAHEIGHAVGFWHEQSRADRDRYIKVHYENIIPGTEHNFDTYVDQGWDGQELTDSLDFYSLLMYSHMSFSKNGNPTITKLDGSYYPYNRSYLSEGDKIGVDKLYPAKGEPEYVDGQRYVLYGLTVTYRAVNGGEWWYYSRIYGWCKVEYRESRGNWYYSRK